MIRPAAGFEVFSQSFKLLAAPLAWRLLSISLRVQPLAPHIPWQKGPVIFACLHRDILGAILYVRPAKPALLVSGSDDGKILTRTLGQKDFSFIQGATGENGSRALVRLRKALEAGHHIGLAVDGPLGPFGEIQAGVFQLAKLTGAAIVPVLPRVKPSLTLGTWDETVVPWLFSRIKVQVGEIERLGPDATEEDFQHLKIKLGDFFLGPGRGKP